MLHLGIVQMNLTLHLACTCPLHKLSNRYG